MVNNEMLYKSPVVEIVYISSADIMNASVEQDNETDIEDFYGNS